MYVESFAVGNWRCGRGIAEGWMNFLDLIGRSFAAPQFTAGGTVVGERQQLPTCEAGDEQTLIPNDWRGISRGRFNAPYDVGSGPEMNWRTGVIGCDAEATGTTELRPARAICSGQPRRAEETCEGDCEAGAPGVHGGTKPVALQPHKPAGETVREWRLLLGIAPVISGNSCFRWRGPG